MHLLSLNRHTTNRYDDPGLAATIPEVRISTSSIARRGETMAGGCEIWRLPGGSGEAGKAVESEGETEDEEEWDIVGGK